MKAKERKGSLNETFKNVRLYRDDLDRFIDLFRAKGLVLTVSDSDFEYDSIDEFVEKCGLRPKDLKIEGTPKEGPSDSISLQFSKEVQLWTWAGEPTRELWFELKDLLRSRSSMLRVVLNPWIWGWSLIAFFNVDAWVFLNKDVYANHPVWAHPFLLSAAGVWLVGLYLRQQPALILQRKHEGGFWRRNADRVLLLLIGAVAGGLVTYIVTTLTR